MPELNFPAHPDLKALQFALNLPPADAVKYLQAKGFAFSFNWQEVWQEAHHKAFTVAKALNIEILQEIRQQVQRSIEEGITFGEFQKQLEPTLKNLGWWGKSYMVNPNSGAVEGVQLGSPRRLKTIYRTNLTVAYSVGRYKQMAENTKHRPYWLYNATLDRRTRPGHAALHGKVFRFDDPIWETIYPPNDWGCRCWVRPLTKSEVESMGLQVEEPGTTKLPPNFAPEEWQYNPGKHAFDAFTPPEMPQAPVPAKDINISGLTRVPIDQLPVHNVSASMLLPKTKVISVAEAKKYINEFLLPFNTVFGKPVVFTDAINCPIVISERLFLQDKSVPESFKVFKFGREQYLRLLADTIKDPEEIWLFFTSDDRSRIFRRYIKCFSIAGSSQSGYAAFDFNKDGWFGVTTFQAKSKEYLDRQRVGYLIYKKKNP
jgi:SPP1 gp7 family putative phage head morphogenesis protein